MSTELDHKSRDPEINDYELVSSDDSDSETTVIATADDSDFIEINPDFEYIANLPYKQKCMHHRFEYTEFEDPQPCPAIRFTKCGHTVRHNDVQFWPLEKPYTCPYICHFLTGKAETFEEKRLARICESSRFSGWEAIFLCELAKSSWFKYDRNLYFDAHRALYTDRLTHQQARDSFWIFGKGCAELAFKVLAYCVVMGLLFMGIFASLAKDTSPDPAIKLMWLMNMGVCAVLVAPAGIFMMFVGWVVRVGVRRSHRLTYLSL